MATYRVAFVYTRTELLDKLEEQLVAALNHYYLLSLLRLYGFTHYLLTHWTAEYQIHVTKTKDVLIHKAKISNAGKLRALREIEDRVNHYDDKLRDIAHTHFLGIFGDDVTSTKKADHWLTDEATDRARDEFWTTIQTWADRNLKSRRGVVLPTEHENLVRIYLAAKQFHIEFSHQHHETNNLSEWTAAEIELVCAIDDYEGNSGKKNVAVERVIHNDPPHG